MVSSGANYPWDNNRRLWETREEAENTEAWGWGVIFLVYLTFYLLQILFKLPTGKKKIITEWKHTLVTYAKFSESHHFQNKQQKKYGEIWLISSLVIKKDSKSEDLGSVPDSPITNYKFSDITASLKSNSVTPSIGIIIGVSGIPHRILWKSSGKVRLNVEKWKNIYANISYESNKINNCLSCADYTENKKWGK